MSTVTRREANPILVLALTLLAGFASILLSAPGFQHWYPTFVKPDYSPPAWTLLPVAVVSTLLLGFGGAIIAAGKPQGHSEMIALRWHWWMVALSFVWLTSFSIRWLDVAYFSAVGVWIAILGGLWTFSKLNGRAAWFLVPYLLWVTYASTVNFNILVQYQRPLIEKMDQDPANDDEPASGITHLPGQPMSTPSPAPGE